MSKKASKKDMYMREVDIHTEMRLGHSRNEIGAGLCDKWGVTAQAIEKQYDKIIKQMREQLAEQREDLRAELLEKTRHLYTKALAEGKIKTAIDAVTATAKIGGLFNEKENQRELPPQKIEIFEEDQSIPKLSAVKGGK